MRTFWKYVVGFELGNPRLSVQCLNQLRYLKYIYVHGKTLLKLLAFPLTLKVKLFRIEKYIIDCKGL